MRPISIPILLLSMAGLALAAEPAAPSEVIAAWLARQSQVTTWSAEVTQTRKIVSLTRPLESTGRVWFTQPNRFRWQLGDPPRTVAVRTGDELRVAYPRLRQLERYPMTGDLDPAWKQVLALLEVGFPSDAATFYATYEVVSVAASEQHWTLELRPAAPQARRLLERIRVELSQDDYTLLATELDFPDGSTLRNDFSGQATDLDLEDSLFVVEAGEGWDVVRPLEEKGR